MEVLKQTDSTCVDTSTTINNYYRGFKYLNNLWGHDFPTMNKHVEPPRKLLRSKVQDASMSDVDPVSKQIISDLKVQKS